MTKGTAFLAFLCFVATSQSSNDVCKRLGDGLAVGDRHECSTYYQCTDGDVILKTCSDGLYFNTEKQICDSPQNVDCSSTSFAPYDPAMLRNLCQINGDGALLSDTNDCSQFYECAGEYAVPLSCSEGLLFDDVKKDCEYPELATCLRS